MYHFCVGDQKHRLVFIMHISLTGKDFQILPGQYLTIFSQGNMHNTCNKIPVEIFFIQGDVRNSYAPNITV